MTVVEQMKLKLWRGVVAPSIERGPLHHAIVSPPDHCDPTPERLLRSVAIGLEDGQVRAQSRDEKFLNFGIVQDCGRYRVVSAIYFAEQLSAA
jgi:hypothetical protein